MKKRLVFFLKLIHLIALTSLVAVVTLFFLSFFQIAYTAKVFFWIYGGAFACYGLAALMDQLFNVIRRGLKNTKVPMVIVNFLYYALPIVATAVASFVWILPESGFLASLVPLIFVGFSYLLGAKVIESPYNFVSTRTGIMTGTITIIVIYVFALSLEGVYDFLHFPYSWYLILYFPLVVSYLFLGNQANIDAMMSRRRTGEAMPKRIRRYNFLLTLLVVAILICLFFFKDTVVLMIKGVGQWLFEAISFILNLLIKDPGDPEEYFYMDQGTNNGGGGGELSDGKTGFLWQILHYILMPAVVIFIFVYYRDQIWWAIKESARKFMHWVMRMIMKMTRNGDVITEDNTEFVDEYQDLTPPERPQETERRQVYKNKRRFLRYLKKVDDPVAYVRECYRYMKEHFLAIGRNLTPADTVREIEQKISSEWNRQRVDQVTGLYEQVRYGEVVPNEEQCHQLREDCISLTES